MPRRGGWPRLEFQQPGKKRPAKTSCPDKNPRGRKKKKENEAQAQPGQLRAGGGETLDQRKKSDREGKEGHTRQHSVSIEKGEGRASDRRAFLERRSMGR